MGLDCNVVGLRRSMRFIPSLLLSLSVWVGVQSLPIDRNVAEQQAKEEVQEETGVTVSVRWVFVGEFVVPNLFLHPPPLQDTGLYYDRYLREVIEVLETDPHFREKLQTANTEDIKVSGDVFTYLGNDVIRGWHSFIESMFWS